VQLAVVLLAVSVPHDTVLLDFSAPWCGPCRAMEPTVDQLSSAGYPIRKVNIDQERDLARRFHISSIPCFVLLHDGKESGRIEGPASASQLRELFGSAERIASADDNRVRGQSPEEPLRRIAPNSAGHQRLLGASRASSAQIMPVASGGAQPANPFRNAAEDRTIDISPAGSHATGKDSFLKFGARLTIEDKDGFSYGSGTIIDTRGDQALVLTCGHIFRESKGQGKISVDLFVPGAPKKIPGRVVSYDLGRDVALVSIRAGVPLTAAPVASEDFRLNRGDRVISVGCNHGGAPLSKNRTS
jgi:thiol-disulfide isomerase/thioredoxin